MSDADDTPHPTATPLEGRNILVVGAGTRDVNLPDMPVGNGRAISVLAAREGATVVCSDVEEAWAQITADWITGEGGSASVIAADVEEPEQITGLVQEAAAASGGHLDGLVFNPGIGWGIGIAGTTAENWDKVMGVNLRAPFLAIQAALPLMKPGASIVLIGSVAGLRPGSGIPSYDTSKSALLGLCRAAALEAGPLGIRINVVAPGLIDSTLGRIATMMRQSRADTPIPLGRQGTAWEVAEVVTFLLSPRASYMTGQTITVDGGLALGS